MQMRMIRVWPLAQESCQVQENNTKNIFAKTLDTGRKIMV
jgi:hypothetical protein